MLFAKIEFRRKAPSVIFGSCMLFAFITLLCSSDIAIDYMKKGLVLCSMTVIPSLFPFMVISELIVSSGIGTRIAGIFSKPMQKFFGIGKSGATAYILGALCGFPIGAKTAISMYDRGEICKRELEHILLFCNNPGSAFVISVVGSSLLGSQELGILLYVCVILSSVTVGIISRFIFKYNGTDGEFSIPSTFTVSGINAVTAAIQSSATAMINVCAYVSFFSAFVGCIGAFLSKFDIPKWISSCIFGLFEISSGVSAASEVGGRFSALLLCALFLGWSGLSVHLQIITVGFGRGISFAPYIVAKAAQGLICTLFTAIGVKLFFSSLILENSSVYLPQIIPNVESSSLPCLAFFLASVAVIVTCLASPTKTKIK